MPTFSRTLLVLLLVSLQAAGLLVPSGRAETTTTASPASVPRQPPKSVFIDDEGFGKDPFFPGSVRRHPKPASRTAEPVAVQQGVPDFIILKGISVLKDKKLAIFNNYTVAEGEDFSLRGGNRVVKVKCIEIKERSAIISVNGISKELPLRPGFE